MTTTGTSSCTGKGTAGRWERNTRHSSRRPRLPRRSGGVEQGKVPTAADGLRAAAQRAGERPAAVSEPAGPAGHYPAHRRPDPLRSKLGGYRNPTVSVPTSTEFVLLLVKKSPSTLRPAQLVELQQLIEQDHRYHLAHNGSASS